MLRTVSLLGIAVLALAAVALVSAQPAAPAAYPQSDESDQPSSNRLMAQLGIITAPYHVRFSLN
jgi:hypothetical protein